MSTAAVHRAQAVSRLAMSPGGIHDDADELSSILNAAKEDLRKERKMKVSAKCHMGRLSNNCDTLYIAQCR